ncbi:MAG: hypothetical protein AAFQ94_18210 [Bacteroidota bacterium]
MDKHLNLFRAFSQNEETRHIEDNLSRAFVLCLKNESLLLHEFLKQILTASDYAYLFDHFQKEHSIDIDIQRKVTDIESESISRLYGVTLSEKAYSMKALLDKYNFSESQDYRPVTDIYIHVKDIVIIIEVKRHDIDARQQLYNQIFQVFSKRRKDESGMDSEKINLIALDWKSLVKNIISVNNFLQISHSGSQFLEDFIQLIKQFNANWIPVKPLFSLSDSKDDDHLRYQRLDTALNSQVGINGMDVLQYSDRDGFYFHEDWANELLYWFQRDQEKLCMYVAMWPGNTKGQGWNLYYNEDNLRWRDKDQLVVDDQSYPLYQEYHLKMTSFQKYFTSIDFSDSQLKPGVQICNRDNFYHYSGRKKKPDWPLLEQFFDESFHAEFDWRGNCHWKEKVFNTDKNQFDISFGFYCYTVIPYEDIKEIDKVVDNSVGLNDYVRKVFDAFKRLNQ